MNIHQRLHAAMNDVDYIQREKRQGMRYSIVSHDAVTAKVRPVLVKHGIVYYPVAIDHSQDGNRTQVKLTVRFANIQEPTDFIDVPSLGYGIDEQDKGPGKAISYAVKYALLKALGLETGDDPDEEQDVEHKPTSKGFHLVHPKTGEVKVIERGGAYLDALETSMKSGDPVQWWAVNGSTARLVAEKFPQAKARVAAIQQIAMIPA